MSQKTPNIKKNKSNSKISDKRPNASSSQKETDKEIPVIGLGASAGGLEALKSFFSSVSKKSGMAYIVVVHMKRDQPSLMHELLQKITSIPVSTVTDGQAIESDNIYIIPPGKELSVYQGTLQLFDLQEKGVTHPINLFLRSLAQDQGPLAAAIILSGTGTDGSLGIKDINAKGGVVFVQTIDSAAYDGMPKSAIDTGMVDAKLSPEEMPKKLLEYFSLTKTILTRKSTTTIPTTTTTNNQQKSLNKIFAVLRIQTGHDFSDYKVNTILRRINRRMVLNQIDNHATYVRFLRKNPVEVETLFRELLIGVTQFFRDPQSFELLKTQILPAVLEKMNEGDTFRAWIPGCSTGEEVYSMVMVLRELIDSGSKRINLQLFGTDIDKYAIEKAREGVFPDSVTADVNQERLKRFFYKEENFYRIRKEIRESVVFSIQDLVKDPPFSRLNMLCCRNLLIYFNTKLQRKLLPLFHYTLKPDGILMLGSSETIGGFSTLFNTENAKWKIYRRQEVPSTMQRPVDFPSGLPRNDKRRNDINTLGLVKKSELTLATQRAILDQFAPSSILVDAKGDILYIQGRTGKYLEAISGPPSQNIIDLARDGLRIELSSAFRAARSSNEQVTRENIIVRTNGDVQLIDLHVCPQKSSKELAGRFLVVFEDVKQKIKTDIPEEGTGIPSGDHLSKLTELEKELQITRENHQITIEELESSNEELKSTNEELQSSNEELQSANEELESSKEELQSLNEELQTVNAEMQSKVEEFAIIQDDMRNLLNSTEIATIFVDNDMCVKRFTPEATKIVNFIQTDIGRPLKHVVTNLAYEGLENDLSEVSKTLTPKEIEVQTTEGVWYKMRIIPYRTMDNHIAGCVITFSSIEDQKKNQSNLIRSGHKSDKALSLVNAIFHMNPEPMVVLDKDCNVLTCNTSFFTVMGIPEKQVLNYGLSDLQAIFPKHTGLTSKLKKSVKDGNGFKTRTFGLATQKGDQIRYKLYGQVIDEDEQYPYKILLRLVKVK